MVKFHDVDLGPSDGELRKRSASLSLNSESDAGDAAVSRVATDASRDHAPSFLASDEDKDNFRSVSFGSESDLIEKKFCGIPEKFANILLLALGFMFNVGALQTCVTCLTVVLNSVHDDLFDGNPTEGYVFMAINCGAQALAYLFGASLSAIVGPKTVLVAGSVSTAFYIACFIRPLASTLYMASIVGGFGSGLIWAVQGHFVAVNSRSDTVERNYGIFWGLFQISSITGSLFYFFMLRGERKIEPRTRFIVFTTLLVSSVIGVVIFCFIRSPWTNKSTTGLPERKKGPRAALATTLRLAKRKDMILLIPHFFYIGMQATFWNNVYATCLGYTNQFGNWQQSLVGLNGVFLGIGEVAACFVLSLLGKWSNRRGRDILLIVGMVIHFVAYYLIFLNLPPESSIQPTDDSSYLGAPSPWLAMFCIGLFGIGDAMWTNQLMAYLGSVYRNECVAAFGVYQFYCAIVNGAAFGYSTVLILPYQFVLLIGMALPAAAGFCLAEWKTKPS